MEKINIPTSNGKNLAAVVHTPVTATDKLAILCPGHLDSKDYPHLIALAEDLVKQGYTVVRFDPLGTWESDGSNADYTITQHLHDIRTVIDYMLGQNHFDHILLGGHSRGGMNSILYAAQDPRISKVLAIMPPYAIIRTVNKDKVTQWKKDGFRVSARDVPGQTAKREFTVPYANIEEDSRHDVLAAVKKVHVPIIFLTGDQDTIVLPADVKTIFEQANEPKKFIVMAGIGHDYRHNPDEIKKVNERILEELK